MSPLQNHLLTSLFILASIILIQPASAQDAALLKQLDQSSYLRSAMKPDSANGAMQRWLQKKVESSRELPLAADFNALQLKGPGAIRVDRSNTISGKGSVLLETPTSLPVKNPTNRSYASAEVVRPLKGENLEGFNRFSVWVYAEAEGFYSFFVGCTGLPSMEEYDAQVKNGIHLGGGFYLRRFPVAYQFRGFHGVLMGKAKAAFLLADLLKDKALKDIATRQLEYIAGFNPFAMSTIYGDGYNYPPLYGAYAGDVVGAVPVGIETFENDDEPYMPMQVNATYKEIWTNTTGSVMWLLAMLFKD